MALQTYIYLGNDTVIEVTGLQNAVDSSYLNAATVTVTINDSAGTEVVSSQALSYVAASNGNYRATLDKALIASLTIGSRYFAIITAAESGIDAQWRMPLLMQYRES